MKKNFLIFLLILIVFILIIYIFYNNIPKESIIQNPNETYLNGIAWPIEFSNVPKINIEPIDFKTENEYYIVYYKNVPKKSIENYIKELQKLKYDIKKDKQNNIIKYIISYQDIHIDIIYENMDMQILLFRNK